MIDHKFETKTKLHFFMIIVWYFLVFAVPHFTVLFGSLEGVQALSALFVALTGQFGMYFLEIIAIKVEGPTTYFKDPWNIMD